MPGMNGIEAAQMITTGLPSARVIMLTTYDEDTNVYASLRAGASGFLVKDMPLDDMIAAVRVVAAGDALIAPGVTRRLIAEFAGRPEPAPSTADLDGITEREREVLTLVGRGLSNAELHISPAPPRPASPACSPSSAPATASSWSSSLMNEDSSRPGAGERAWGAAGAVDDEPRQDRRNAV